MRVESHSGINQTIAAHAGDQVTVHFWYFADPDAPNFFLAEFDEQDLVSFTDDTEHPDWTEFAFPVTVTANSPLLQFSFQNDFGFDNLDDVSIPPATNPPSCYANCDGSTTAPCLNVSDFGCFLNRFNAGDTYANCDGSTTPPVLNVQDFGCFLNRFNTGCGTNC